MTDKFDWVTRKSENLCEYQTRLNEHEPVHVGYAFLGEGAYNKGRGIYGLYIIWNGYFNKKLTNPNPEFGFVTKCNSDEACDFYKVRNGIPLFGKIASNNGDLFCTEYFIIFNNTKYNISYLGMSVKKPSFVCFQSMEDFAVISDYDKKTDCENEINSASDCSNSNFNLGSFNTGSFNAGSFNVSSFNVGRFNTGSFNAGSFNLSSFNLGGFNTSSFNIGSFNLSSFNLSGFNIGRFNSGSFNLGSFNTGSFNLWDFWAHFNNNQSFNISSFNIGSFNLPFVNNGSFNQESFNSGSFNSGSFNISYFFANDTDYDNSSAIVEHYSEDRNRNSNSNGREPDSIITTVPKNELTPERLYYDIYGEGCLGYGLNLI